MTNRIASTLALIAFALCLLLGMGANNTFTTTVTRALVAMTSTFALGLLIGGAAQKMLDENLQSEEKKLKDTTPAPSPER